MRLVQTTVAWALVTCPAAATEPVTMQSPDGKMSFSLSTGPQGPAFDLTMDGQALPFDSPYTIGSLSKLGETLIGPPMTPEMSCGECMAITEAHLQDHAGLCLATSPRMPKTLLTRLSTRGNERAVVRVAPFETPWRAILLGCRAGDHRAPRREGRWRLVVAEVESLRCGDGQGLSAPRGKGHCRHQSRLH